MIVGKVSYYMKRMKPGTAIILDINDLIDSAKAYTTSNIYDNVRQEDLNKLIDEINSDEYPDFSIMQHFYGHFVLRKHNFDLR